MHVIAFPICRCLPGDAQCWLYSSFLINIPFFTMIKKKERALSLSILTMSGPGKFPRVESN